MYALRYADAFFDNHQPLQRRADAVIFDVGYACSGYQYATDTDARRTRMHILPPICAIGADGGPGQPWCLRQRAVARGRHQHSDDAGE